MNTLATLARHIITYLVGMLIAWLTIYLTGADLESATKAANALIEPLVIVAGFVAVIVARLAMPVLNKIFRPEAEEKSGGVSGGMALLVLWLGLSMAVVGTLPSCVPGQEYPLSGTVSYRDPRTGAKGGLVFVPGQPVGGRVQLPIYDPQTGAVLGAVDLRSGK